MKYEGTEWNRESIRALRQHMGLTQQEMARGIGTRQQTISEWERGVYKPRGTSATLLSIVAERTSFKYGTTNDAGDCGYSPEQGFTTTDYLNDEKQEK